MLAKVYSGAVIGLDAVLIEVEIDIASQGLPNFTIVGLPDKAVEEAKERVRSAIRNSGLIFRPGGSLSIWHRLICQKKGPPTTCLLRWGYFLPQVKFKPTSQMS